MCCVLHIVSVERPRGLLGNGLEKLTLSYDAGSDVQSQSIPPVAASYRLKDFPNTVLKFSGWEQEHPASV